MREIRTLKARMESERLPRGADPKAHLKLGRGGLSDVEWTVQLLQLRHGCEVPALRTTSHPGGRWPRRGRPACCPTPTPTPSAPRGGWPPGCATPAVLWRGRPVDALPSDLRDADGIGRIVGREPGTGAALAEDYRRLARRARAAVVSNFYESA